MRASRMGLVDHLEPSNTAQDTYEFLILLRLNDMPGSQGVIPRFHPKSIHIIHLRLGHASTWEEKFQNTSPSHSSDELTNRARAVSHTHYIVNLDQLSHLFACHNSSPLSVGRPVTLWCFDSKSDWLSELKSLRESPHQSAAVFGCHLCSRIPSRRRSGRTGTSWHSTSPPNLHDPVSCNADPITHHADIFLRGFSGGET